MKVVELLEAFAKTPVKSSHIVDIEYNGKNLFVTFNNGSRYEYYDVPEQVANPIIKSPSKGKYMWANIRDQYKYRKMDSGEVTPINLKGGIPVNYAIQAPNGDNYIWKGRQWINSRNGRIARKEISKGLTDYAISQNK